MRDDSHKWDRLTKDDVIELPNGARLSHVKNLTLTMISGPNVLKQIDAPQVGWPDVIDTDRYAVVMRRDRVLLVGDTDLTEGWDDTKSLAISDMTHGYDVFDLSGPHALSMLQQGTEIHLDEPSRSAVRLAFGLGLHIYRYGAEDTFRVHVLTHQREALIGYLKAVLNSQL
ncbi:hypothetical protein SAMN05444003_2912 [Cognatiyoonia sediminum]|uniref:Sarcosine oxidase subunit gamma n=1 Tax=Cognatiyoonia sediminum TaxID=1508389 RepID=A0A1M5SDP1_9RHOB|nr:hypothetical protein [Cognatiyoonia sediminum]SHH36581.1 hypothetical protein SAMN05444003_2912 [Cognatiyoonia sediminum]